MLFLDSVISSVTYEVLDLVLDDDMVSTEGPLYDEVRFSVFFLGIREGTSFQCKQSLYVARVQCPFVKHLSDLE